MHSTDTKRNLLPCRACIGFVEYSVLFLVKKVAVVMSRAWISSAMCYLFHSFCCQTPSHCWLLWEGTITPSYSSWQLKDSLLLLCYTSMIEILQKQKEKKSKKIERFLTVMPLEIFLPRWEYMYISTVLWWQWTFNGNYPERYRKPSAHYYTGEKSDRITQFQLLPTTSTIKKKN